MPTASVGMSDKAWPLKAVAMAPKPELLALTVP